MPDAPVPCLYPSRADLEEAMRAAELERWPGKSVSLLDHLDEFCLDCLAGDCGSCEGGPCQCLHDSEPPRFAVGGPL